MFLDSAYSVSSVSSSAIVSVSLSVSVFSASASVSGLPSDWPTTSASQNLRLIRVMRILTLSPGLVLGTKTTRPLILAMPSPLWLVSWISTSYSLPMSTGLGGNLCPP